MTGRGAAWGSALVVMLAVRAVAAQRPPSLTSAEQGEVELARSAAPAAISDSADVLVLRDSAYVRVVRGTNGVACLVGRPRAGSVVPVCYDPRAARSLVPAELMAHRFRAGGKSPEAADSAVEAAFRAGRLPMPVAGAMGWMMSPKQVFVGASGNTIGAWRPHVMVYTPGTAPATTGFASVGRGEMFVDHVGRATSHVVIVTAKWADGSPGPE